jgi:hypothetical protein
MLIVFLCRLVSDAHSSESFDGQTFYFGDLHAHTGISPDGGSSDAGSWPGAYPCWDPDPLDGIDPPCGSLEGAFDAARDTYHLDFVSFTDHSSPDTDPDLFYDFLQRGLEKPRARSSSSPAQGVLQRTPIRPCTTGIGSVTQDQPRLPGHDPDLPETSLSRGLQGDVGRVERDGRLRRRIGTTPMRWLLAYGPTLGSRAPSRDGRQPHPDSALTESCRPDVPRTPWWRSAPAGEIHSREIDDYDQLEGSG